MKTGQTSTATKGGIGVILGTGWAALMELGWPTDWGGILGRLAIAVAAIAAAWCMWRFVRRNPNSIGDNL